MRFYFHYNKPASLKAGRNVLSLHFKQACHLINKVICLVPITSVDRATQPRCILRGDAKDIRIREGVAIIQ